MIKYTAHLGLGVFVLVTMLTIIFSVPTAQARSGALTDEVISEFIQKTTAILSGRTAGMDLDEVQSYLERHLHEDSRFKSTMVYRVPGFPAQESALSVNKKEFIDSVKTGEESLDNYETTVEVLNIKISRDGRKATVQTVSQEAALMPISEGADGSQETVQLQGSSTCTQILMLSKNDVLQMYNANCRTTISFDGF